jgi:hypothetical protein
VGRRAPALLAAAGLFYVWVHLSATIGALIWARLERPHAFARARDTFLATQMFTVAGYLVVPVAPPRMLPGFTDTLAALAASASRTPSRARTRRCRAAMSPLRRLRRAPSSRSCGRRGSAPRRSRTWRW